MIKRELLNSLEIFTCLPSCPQPYRRSFNLDVYIWSKESLIGVKLFARPVSEDPVTKYL